MKSWPRLIRWMRDCRCCHWPWHKTPAGMKWTFKWRICTFGAKTKAARLSSFSVDTVWFPSSAAPSEKPAAVTTSSTSAYANEREGSRPAKSIYPIRTAKCPKFRTERLFSTGDIQFARTAKWVFCLSNCQKRNGKKFGECFAVLCNKKKNKYKVYMKSGAKNLRFVCDRKGQKSRGMFHDFDFFCQNPIEVCKPRTNCPLDCHQRYN